MPRRDLRHIDNNGSAHPLNLEEKVVANQSLHLTPFSHTHTRAATHIMILKDMQNLSSRTDRGIAL